MPWTSGTPVVPRPIAAAHGDNQTCPPAHERVLIRGARSVVTKSAPVAKPSAPACLEPPASRGPSAAVVGTGQLWRSRPKSIAAAIGAKSPDAAPTGSGVGGAQTGGAEGDLPVDTERAEAVSANEARCAGEHRRRPHVDA